MLKIHSICSREGAKSAFNRITPKPRGSREDNLVDGWTPAASTLPKTSCAGEGRLPTALPRSAKPELDAGVVVYDANQIVGNARVRSDPRDAKDLIAVPVEEGVRLDAQEVRLSLSEPEVALYRCTQLGIGDPSELVQPVAL